MNAKQPSSCTIGFIGTGVMGVSMAGHLLAAGFPLLVHNRTRLKAEPLEQAGACWCNSPFEVAERSDVVFTIVGYPDDVRRLYLGAKGLVESVRSGVLLVDMTTSSPQLAAEIAAVGASRGLDVLDAPVSGGDRGARDATLSIMAGGTPSAFARARPLLEILGQTIVHHGAAGAGQHAKMCNQIAIASGLVGVCEAIRYAEVVGLDPEALLCSIESGAAGSWSLSNLAPRILAGDFAPGFYVHHFLKDLGIALECAAEMDLDLPGMRLARQLYADIAERGLGDSGTQALIEFYRKNPEAGT